MYSVPELKLVGAARHVVLGPEDFKDPGDPDYTEDANPQEYTEVSGELAW